MPKITKILLPVDFPNASLGVIHQSATLARKFNAQILMLHVITGMSHAAGVPYPGHEPPGWNLRDVILSDAKKRQDLTLAQELDGLSIQCILAEGDPDAAIVHAAETEDTDLIMLSSHGFVFDAFLLGSVTTKILQKSERPVWTSSHVEEAGNLQRLAIRNILCAVDLGPRSEEAISWAYEISTQFNAHITLAHVTAGIEIWGPGGWNVDQEWKAALVHDASQRIAKLKQDTGISADVFIGSGDVPSILSRAAKQTDADLLVTGCYPYGGNLRTHGYGIICAVPTPVLNV